MVNYKNVAQIHRQDFWNFLNYFRAQMVQNDLWPKSKLQFLIVILFERKESRKRSCPAVVYDQTVTYGNRRNSLETNDARRLVGRRRIVH